MKSENQLPSFRPFKELVVCSNKLINGKVAIEINEHPVLIVGNNHVGRVSLPLIWLATPGTPTAAANTSQWHYIVNENQSSDWNIVVIPIDRDKAGGSSVIVSTVNPTTKLVMVRKINEEKAEVESMDLRPLGLSIYGDADGLYVGTRKWSGNIFKDLRAMISI